MVIENEDETWFGAELASAESEGRVKIGGEFFRVCGHGAGQNEQRVGAGYFREEGNWSGAINCEVEESAASAVRSGEGGGFDEGMLHESRTDGRAGIEKQRENAFGQIVFFDGGLYGAANELAGAGMRRMSFDDDGISGGECRGSVATGDGKREREIAGAEDDNGAQGPRDGANFGLASWFASGVGAIDPRR